jgi:hypothetical protein
MLNITAWLRSRLPRVVAFAFAVLFLLHARPARAVEKIDWPSFDDVLPDSGWPQNNCDIVHVDIQHGAVDPGQIELALDVGTSVVWWKGVGIGLDNGKYYEISTAQDRHDSISLDAYDVMTARYILLGKAKFLGLHTGMYELNDMSALQGGDRVSFQWAQDGCQWVDAWTSSLPDWLPPKTTQTISIIIKNYGETWRPDEFLEVHVNGLATEYQWVTTTVPRLSIYVVNVTFTTPVMTGDYELSVKLFQGSKYSWWIGPPYHRVHVSPNPPSPPPTPAPPPPPVRVPNLVGMSLEDAEKQLADLGLADFVHDRDSSIPADQAIVWGQSPMGGSSVADGTTVHLYMMQPGFASLVVVNCSLARHTVHIWEYVNDRWFERGAAAPMWDDSGTLCPGGAQSLFEYALTDGAIQYFAIVDPQICSQGNDPTYTACHVGEATTFGSGKGLPFPFVVD